MAKAKARAQEAPNMVGELIKAAFLASAASLLLIVIYSFAMWQQWLGVGSIAAVTVGIKGASAALAGFLVSRRCKSRAWLWGALAGAAFSALAYAVFSILSDTYVLSLAFLSDIGVGALAGMLAAMILRAAK